MSDQPEILKDITGSPGYWRMLIRPSQHEAKRISSLLELTKIIEKNQVQLRGWYFPHIDRDGPRNHNNFIESTTNAKALRDIKEFFRFYLSGQFVFYSIMREDDPETKARERLESFGYTAKKGLEFVNTVWTITEMYEFTRRLVTAGILIPEFELTIELHGTKDRSLFFWDNGRELWREYKCSESFITLHNVYQSEEFLGKALSFAADEINKVFQLFNLNDVQRKFIEQDQQRLLQRRF